MSKKKQMERIDRIANNLTFKDAFNEVEKCRNLYKDHKVFLRRKEWHTRLYWEMKESDPIGYRVCEITENCIMSLLTVGITTNVDILDSISSDWEVWVEVKF